MLVIDLILVSLSSFKTIINAQVQQQPPRLNFETFLCYIIIQFCNLMPTNSKIQNDEMKNNIPNVHIWGNV